MRVGEVVANRFEIEALAGSGGMGAVYRARDRVAGAHVALKLLRETSTDIEERFDREARILADVRHPSVVQYLAHGVTNDGQHWLAIEWLEGHDLQHRLAHEGVTTQEAKSIVLRAATALAAVHPRGIVHRDIKPSNVFLVGDDAQRVKLLDFGIARVDRTFAGTRSGVMLGTPGYMAPEQARGDATVDARADVFALGCVLFECLAGRAPFVGEHVMAIMAKILLADAPRVRELRADVPIALDDLVARMLSKDPARRPQDGAAVALELEAIDAASGSAPARTPSAISEISAADERLVSVVLATRPTTTLDLRGSNLDVARTLTTEEALHPIDRLRAAVVQFGGVLDVLVDGTVVVTLVGSGVASDQAGQAARCALKMRAVAPEISLALATGRARVSRGSPIGESIDRAASLLKTAKSVRGTIAIDEATAGLLDPRFEIESHDKTSTTLTGEREQPDKMRTLLGRPTSCVGRERELSTLDAVLRECVEESIARAVLVTAPVGMGKSRLRNEWLRRVRERASPAPGAQSRGARGAVSEESVEIILARGDPMSAGSPFGMLAGALRRLAAIRDNEPIALRRQKLRARVTRNVPSGAADRVTEFLGELAGVPFPDDESVQLRAARQDPTLMGDQMRAAFEDFLAAECAARPVVLVLEDLHWGDLPTVRFVDAALRQLRDRPFMLLALARPEVHDRFPKVWSSRALTEVQLGDLSRRAAERLIAETLGKQVDPALVATIVERAAGNAFFLEELIRAVAEGNVTALPSTVVATVQARLDALDGEARRVVRAASVFGRIFWSGGVMALLGGARAGARLADWLPTLADRELVERRPSERFPGEDEYSFRHALVRDVAYSTLSEVERAGAHRLAGAWLEDAGESDALVLAEHFDRGGDARRAIAWFRRAAEQALEGHDLSATIAHARRGAALGASAESLGALRSLESEAHRWRGEFSEARARAIEAAALLAAGTVAWFRALDEVMMSSGRQADYADALAWGDRACSVVAQPEARTAQIISLCSAARLRFHAGDYAGADALVARIADIARDAGDLEPRAEAEVHRMHGARARHVGDLEGDIRGYEAALQAFERAGDARNACNARVSLGFAFVELGDVERADEELRRALAAADRMGLPTVSMRARQNLALVLLARGDAHAARKMADDVVAESHAQRNVRFEGWTRIYVSNAARAADDAKEAEKQARIASELLAPTPPARAGALAALALALIHLERKDEAANVAREAASILERLGGIEEFEALVRLAHAESLRAVGDEQAARTALKLAADRIEARAATIASARWRKTFVENVRENARTLQLLREWGGDDPPTERIELTEPSAPATSPRPAAPASGSRR